MSRADCNQGSGCRKGSRKNRLVVETLSILCLLAAGGCIIVPPTRVTTSIKTVGGTTARLAPPAEVGKSTRQQVEEQYRVFAVDSGIPKLFWARYMQSKWYVAIAPGPATRVWKTQNILVTFDEDERVKTFEVVPDDGLLPRLKELQSWGAIAPLDISSPIPIECTIDTLEVPHAPWRFEISSSGLNSRLEKPAWNASKEAKKQRVKTGAYGVAIPIDQIADLTVLDVGNNLTDPFETKQNDLLLRFTQKTSVGKSLEFYADPKETLTIARWFLQVHPEKVKPPKRSSR